MFFLRPKQTDVADAPASETPSAAPAPAVEERTETVFSSVSAAEKIASKDEEPKKDAVAETAASSDTSVAPAEVQKEVVAAVTAGLDAVAISEDAPTETTTTKKKKKKSSYMDF
jgi:hypothetical protein